MKKKAGNEIQILSLSLILTIKPRSISKKSPKEETIKMGRNTKPNRRPVAPKNCKIITIKLSFSKLKRLNSLFMCGDMK
tara:strand:- start:653 stop:889 length:237 start_codon:yes stop_codon:yes gene_type:complete